MSRLKLCAYSLFFARRVVCFQRIESERKFMCALLLMCCGKTFFLDRALSHFGPADYTETVNTIGLPRYAKQYPMPNGKGINLEVQMNAISLCTRPEVLRQGVMAA